MNRSLAEALVSHHLRIIGGGHFLRNNKVSLFTNAVENDVQEAMACVRRGCAVIAISPDGGFLSHIGVRELVCVETSLQLLFPGAFNALGYQLKTLHRYQTYAHPEGEAIVVSKENLAVWLWIPNGEGGFLIIGTDFAADLLRYRQGDPNKATNRPTQSQWGIAGERPTYLFEDQLAGEDGSARHADQWAMALGMTLSRKIGEPLADILPGGAPGAIVITGDDDQAYLEKYDEQLRVLDGTPITYLLHPLTRHTRKTLKAMQQVNPGIDFGIHPDALEAPGNYGKLFDEQVAWYRSLTDAPPLSLRNHGFLNDGYWGHLDAWIKHDVKISSNLPGLDGRVLNGSLLPARMSWRGELTNHWSILTSMGDGVRFVSGMSDMDAADRVWGIADGIRLSKFPGVMVLNLHPQNIAETRAMHQVAKEIVRSGFVAWNLRQCWEWFTGIDRRTSREIEAERTGAVSRVWTALRRLTMDARTK